jgi:hypothetical protein
MAADHRLPTTCATRWVTGASGEASANVSLPQIVPRGNGRPACNTMVVKPGHIWKEYRDVMKYQYADSVVIVLKRERHMKHRAVPGGSLFGFSVVIGGLTFAREGIRPTTCVRTAINRWPRALRHDHD